METLKIDRTKLMTVANYAKKRGVTPATIYNWNKAGDVKFEEIDGVKFVKLP